MRTLATALIVITLAMPSMADEIQVIDLLHLNATEFARSLGGGGTAGDALANEATDFAVGAMRDIAAHGRGRTSLPDSVTYSRARSVSGGASDLSHLLPEGLAAPPMAAP